MSELARKICLLGDFGVGKTSLVARFVRNTFSDKYLTTVGVKVDTREVATPGGARKLVVWDIAGRNALDTVSQTYIRGASGLVLVADGTREPTLRAALYLQVQARTVLGEVPAVLLVNKLDRVDDWEIKPATLAELRKTLVVFETSARTGDHVEAAFAALAERLPA
jgi:small GTP-binding protein